jgi:hypothetical protein
LITLNYGDDNILMLRAKSKMLSVVGYSHRDHIEELEEMHYMFHV